MDDRDTSHLQELGQGPLPELDLALPPPDTGDQLADRDLDVGLANGLFGAAEAQAPAPGGEPPSEFLSIPEEYFEPPAVAVTSAVASAADEPSQAPPASAYLPRVPGAGIPRNRRVLAAAAVVAVPALVAGLGMLVRPDSTGQVEAGRARSSVTTVARSPVTRLAPLTPAGAGQLVALPAEGAPAGGQPSTGAAALPGGRPASPAPGPAVGASPASGRGGPAPLAATSPASPGPGPGSGSGSGSGSAPPPAQQAAPEPPPPAPPADPVAESPPPTAVTVPSRDTTLTTEPPPPDTTAPPATNPPTTVTSVPQTMPSPPVVTRPCFERDPPRRVPC